MLLEVTKFGDLLVKMTHTQQDQKAVCSCRDN